MRSDGGLGQALDALASAELSTLPDESLRDSVLGLLTVQHRLQAELSRRLGEFDRRGLARADGQACTKRWLQAFAHLGGHAADAQVKALPLLELLPELRQALTEGAVSLEHVNQVRFLHERLGAQTTVQAAPILVRLARASDPMDVRRACDRICAHRDPDGPDPARTIQRRQVTLSRVGDMWQLRGQLDPEAGTLVHTALQAYLKPPTPQDTRSAAQRRHDALVEIVRAVLREARTPTIGGVHPHIGVLLPVDLLPFVQPDRADHAPNGNTNNNASNGASNNGGSSSGGRGGGSSNGASSNASNGASNNGGSSSNGGSGGGGGADNGGGAATAARAGSGDTAWLDDYGPIPNAVAARIACDAAWHRIILDPTNGLPLDVGRAYRTSPPWIRKALTARDRGCRFPGCSAEANWTDAHHMRHWKAHNGRTTTDNLVLICRFHHVLIHEGGWTLQVDPATGEVSATRPDGRPYALPPTRPWTTASHQPATDDP